MCSSCYKKWYRDNHPKTRKAKDGEVRRSLRWRADHDRKPHDQKYRDENREVCNARIRVWSQANPEKVRAKDALRRAMELNACPSWADLKAIEAIYAEARRLTRKTGILRHVDHIYPLVSPYVCGLHVAENLQILTKSENLSKGNKIKEIKWLLRKHL
jgi:hypothetical protein